jgi:hypothetical protein
VYIVKGLMINDRQIYYPLLKKQIFFQRNFKYFFPCGIKKSPCWKGLQTSEGRLFRIQESGEPFVVEGVVLCRVSDGKIFWVLVEFYVVFSEYKFANNFAIIEAIILQKNRLHFNQEIRIRHPFPFGSLFVVEFPHL